MITLALTGFLSLVDGAVFLVSRRGRVVSKNNEAALVTRTDSYCVLSRDRHLVFRDPKDDEAYLNALSLAFGSGLPRMSTFPIAGAPSPDAVAFLLPFAQVASLADKPVQPVFSLLILRPCAFAAAPRPILRALYGLTAAEIDIVDAIVMGMSLDGAADCLGIARTTARNQVSSAMAKMGVNRQAQLVAQVGALIPRLRLS